MKVTEGSHIKWSGPPELNIIFSLNTKTGSLIFKTIRELSVRLQIQQISDKTPTSKRVTGDLATKPIATSYINLQQMCLSGLENMTYQVGSLLYMAHTLYPVERIL